MSTRRRLWWPACAGALVVLLLAVSAAVATSPCLEQCEAGQDCCVIEPTFAAPCAQYKACADAAKSDLDDRIAKAHDCQPINPGRCTLVLGCVQFYQSVYNAKLKQCAKQSFRHLSHTDPDFDCTLGHAAQKRAAQLCTRQCPSVTTTTSESTSTSTTTSSITTTTVSAGTTTTTKPPRQGGGDNSLLQDRCFRPCLHRINSFRSCINDCASKCQRNETAENICRTACRNLVCEAMMARCFDTGNPDVDQGYVRCCDARNSCDNDPSDAPCEVTTTTTTSTSSTTATLATTTSTSTTTTSPQI
jgi:hypothetical protein